MKQKMITVTKLTHSRWLNLFRAKYTNSKGKTGFWMFASRKEEPLKDDKPDAVVLVVTVDTPEGRKLVVTKEYRVPINDYEYGFPAGLIDGDETLYSAAKRELKEETGLDIVSVTEVSNKVVSSAGLSDETVVMMFIEAKGELSAKYQEDTEDIEAFLYDIKDIRNLLASDKKIGAKGWGVLHYFSKMGKI